MMNKTVYVLFLVLAVSAGAASATSWRVEQDGSGAFTTLQPAVDAAASGDTILIGPGWYQELHWVDHYGSPIQVGAYWTDDKDLSFIGTSAAEVKIGPSTYVVHLDGPQGIFQEGLFRNKIFVSGVTFVNLYIGADSFGSIEVTDCIFNTGGVGVTATQGDTCRVSNSTFVELSENACSFFSCGDVDVDNCELGAYVYFGNTGNGVIRNCVGNGRSFGYYYQSGGVVEDNEAVCSDNPCISAVDASAVTLRRNHLTGGSQNVSILGPGVHVVLEDNIIENPENHNILISDGATLQATGNDFIKAYGAGKYLVMCSQYSGGVNPVTIIMENNYWAQAGTGAFTLGPVIGAAIWDYNDDPDLKAVIDFEPFSMTPVPVEEQSLGSIKSMFR